MRLNQRGAVLPTVLILSVVLISLSASYQVLLLGRMRQLNLLKESYELQAMEAMVLDDCLSSSERSQDATYVFNKADVQVDWQAENKLVLTANHREGLSRQTEYEVSREDAASQEVLEENIEEVAEENKDDILPHKESNNDFEKTEKDQDIEEAEQLMSFSAVIPEEEEAGPNKALRPGEILEKPE